MNIENLKKAEAQFLLRYPGGFQHEEMIAIGKKHKMSKMVELSQSLFSQDKFARPHTIVDNMVSVISRSSMVSMFEKPKFKSFANALNPMEKELLSHGLEERLYGNEEQGFEIMLELLQTRKMAKWTLMTICSAYFDPQNSVFVKPTTTKGIIKYLELTNLEYKPLPSWGFYREYRRQISELKRQADPSLSPTNAAFTGFLMMSI